MFEQIKQTLGNMDGQYQAKTPVTAFLVDVKDVEYSKSSGKPGQSLYLRHDQTGEIAWVKLTGKFDALTAADKGTTRDFLIWPFKPESSPKTYLYCWIQRQTAQQAPQQAAQATKPPPGIDIQSQIMAMAERFLKAIETLAYPNATTERPTQPSGPNPDYVGDDPPPPDDTDVPF